VLRAGALVVRDVEQRGLLAHEALDAREHPEVVGFGNELRRRCRKPGCRGVFSEA
jgi:hypothetical protein